MTQSPLPAGSSRSAGLVSPAPAGWSMAATTRRCRSFRAARSKHPRAARQGPYVEQPFEEWHNLLDLSPKGDLVGVVLEDLFLGKALLKFQCDDHLSQLAAPTLVRGVQARVQPEHRSEEH